jgi:hypothetical protein
VRLELIQAVLRWSTSRAGGSQEVGFPVRILSGSEAVFRVDAPGGDMDSVVFRVPIRYPKTADHLRHLRQPDQSARETVEVPSPPIRSAAN